MITALSFIAVIILLVWVTNLSNRLTILEGKSRGAKELAPEHPQPAGFLHKPKEETLQEPAKEFHKPSDETVVATDWLNKIGILALVLGIGFFIKYAIDQGWISQWTRVILGVAIGALLCGLGHLWRQKYANYAAALTGGGLAVMYFSIFAAYQYYHLVPQAVAWVLLVAISALGIFLAHDRKSWGLGLLAVAGSYLAPVMLNSGLDQHTALFAYVTLLNIVAVAVAMTAYANELLFLAFLGSVSNFVWWGSNYASLANTWPATAFCAVTFLLFTIGGAVALRMHAKIPQENSGKYFGLLSLLLGVFYSASLGILLYQHFHEYLSIMALLGSVGAFLAYAIVDRLEHKPANFCLAFVGTALLALACIWQFSGKTTDFMLIAFGLLLVIVGVFLRRSELRVWGLLTLVGCVFAVLFTAYDNANYVFILNSKFGLVLAETAALWLTGWLYSRVEPDQQEAMAAESAHVIGSLLLWFGFSWELAQFFRNDASMNTRNLLLSLWWMGYATALIIFGTMAKSPIYKKLPWLFLF